MVTDESDPAMNAILLTDLMAELAEPRVRYPLVRAGERAPIPQVVRLSVYRRDGFRCRFCGDDANLELDHMLPWSAGGPDLSGNLRTLCTHCNQERSNWNDGEHVPNLRPTTWWCFECWRHPRLDPAEDPCDPPDVEARGWRGVWRNGVDLTRAPFVTGAEEQVYCAWCRGYGYSDVWFGPGQQDRLAALVNDPHTPAAPPPDRSHNPPEPHDPEMTQPESDQIEEASDG